MHVRKAIERHVPMRIIISLSVSPAAAMVDTSPIRGYTGGDYSEVDRPFFQLEGPFFQLEGQLGGLPYSILGWNYEERARSEHVPTSRTHSSIYLSGVRGESGACDRVRAGRFYGF